MSCLETKTARILSMLLAFALAVPLANATILNNGDNLPPDQLTAGGNLMGMTSGTITTQTWSANYTEWVYSDPNNTFCAGCLDFVYQFTNNPNSQDVLERFTGFSYGAFKIDAGYDPNSGGRAPGTVSRSNNGFVLGFNYLGSDIQPGETTPLLIAQTDATNFVSGFLTAQDGNAGYAEGFAPGVPDPATLGLLGSGLAVAGSVLRRRRLL